MAMTKTKIRKTSRRCRATPGRLRPHCYAIRKDLDPGRYPTIGALKAAIANGTFDRSAGAQTQAEVDAMNKDTMLA